MRAPSGSTSVVLFVLLLLAGALPPSSPCSSSAPLEARAQCLFGCSCPAGTFIVTNQFGFKSCVACNETDRQYTRLESLPSCSRCPANFTYVPATNCFCPSPTSYLASEGESCLPCPIGSRSTANNSESCANPCKDDGSGWDVASQRCGCMPGWILSSDAGRGNSGTGGQGGGGGEGLEGQGGCVKCPGRYTSAGFNASSCTCAAPNILRPNGECGPCPSSDTNLVPFYPPGSSQRGNATQCVCPAPTFALNPASGRCEACPPGLSSEGTGNATSGCACPLGSYLTSSSSNPSGCAACPSGMTSTKRNATSCSCPPTSVLVLLNETIPSCRACPVGFLAANPLLAWPSSTDGTAEPAGCQCPAGSYVFASGGTVACIPCPPGFSSSGTNATDCTKLAPEPSPSPLSGGCVNSTNATSCPAACREGTFRPPPSDPAGDCIPCSAGTFSGPNATACLVCPPESVAPSAGSATCVPCAGETSIAFSARGPCVAWTMRVKGVVSAATIGKAIRVDEWEVMVVYINSTASANSGASVARVLGERQTDAGGMQYTVFSVRRLRVEIVLAVLERTGGVALLPGLEVQAQDPSGSCDMLGGQASGPPAYNGGVIAGIVLGGCTLLALAGITALHVYVQRQTRAEGLAGARGRRLALAPSEEGIDGEGGAK